MAGKRLLDPSGSDPDQPIEKRNRTRPSFASVIGEVVMVNFLHNFSSALEPMLRRVLSEEVENGLQSRGRSLLTRSLSWRIEAAPQEPPSSLQLVFPKKPSLPIFTGTKIVDSDNSSLQVFLVDTAGGQFVPTSLCHPIKVELVVLDGDFPPAGDDGDRRWSSEEFDKSIVRERPGKRPLLAGGDSIVTLRDGFAQVGEIEFTDNSSWIRSRKFRVGARVVRGTGGGQGVSVREGMTEAFIVKDHRGELYKKHHPPMLHDDVWRLEKIGKDGAFHKKLACEGINTVQDFLKLFTVEPNKLRKILGVGISTFQKKGVGMSEKTWEATVKHARTCVVGNKLYKFRGPSYSLTLNPICQVVKAVINGHTMFPTLDFPPMYKAYLEVLTRDAYQNWNSLEEVDVLLEEMSQLTHGDMVEQYPDHHQSMELDHIRNVHF